MVTFLKTQEKVSGVALDNNLNSATYLLNISINASNTLRDQRSAAGIFKKFKAVDISLIIYQWKAFSFADFKKMPKKL